MKSRKKNEEQKLVYSGFLLHIFSLPKIKNFTLKVFNDFIYFF